MQTIQPSIYFFGVEIMEPMTSLTDLLVSFVCFWAFFKLNKIKNKNTTIKLYSLFFVFMGLATTYGGIIGHAFIYNFSFAWKIPAWLLSMVSIAILERAAIFHAKPLMKPQIGNFFAAINLVEFFSLAFISVYTLNFFFVEAHAAYGMIVVVFSFELYVFIKTKDTGSKIVLQAVVVAVLSAITHLSKFSLAIYFNYLDISHVLMAVSAYLLYKAVLKMNLISNQD